MDQFFRPEGQTNTFGFDGMRRELNFINTQTPTPLHTQTPPPGAVLSFELEPNFRMDVGILPIRICLAAATSSRRTSPDGKRLSCASNNCKSYLAKRILNASTTRGSSAFPYHAAWFGRSIHARHWRSIQLIFRSWNILATNYNRPQREVQNGRT